MDRMFFRNLAREVKEVWLDVDGVMTRQGDLAIYDVGTPDHPAFERKDGVQSFRFVTCDEHGMPEKEVVEYLAGFVGEPIMEGYRFDTRDGRMIERAVKAGFPVHFVSGRNSPCVLKRAINLGARPLLGEKDKVVTIERESLAGWDHILFIGDGVQDVGALERAYISVAPADASSEAIAVAKFVTAARGGEGVVDEVLRMFFEARKVSLD